MGKPAGLQDWAGQDRWVDFAPRGARRLIQQTMKCTFFIIIIIFMNTDFDFLLHLLGKSRFSRLIIASINVQIQSVLSGGGATLTLF